MTTPTPPPPAAPGPDPATEARLSRMEAMLAQVIPTSHAQAQAHTERRLDRPDEVREQVAAALRQAEKDRAARETADQAKAAHDELAAQVKQMQESKPQSPLRAVERFMGWGGPGGG